VVKGGSGTHEIATRRRSVEAARRFSADSIAAMMKGQSNDYLEGLRFDVRKMAKDRDKPFRPGSTSGKRSEDAMRRVMMIGAVALLPLASACSKDSAAPTAPAAIGPDRVRSIKVMAVW
jgi:hypothetical protein